MGFSIVFLILMVGTGLWPIRLTTCLDSFPEEELLLSHLCIKWKVDCDLPKLEKMNLVQQKLESVIQTKAKIDERLHELAAKDQEDPLVYKEIINDPNWPKIRKLLDKMLNHECSVSYFAIELEIMSLKDIDMNPEKD